MAKGIIKSTPRPTQKKVKLLVVGETSYRVNEGDFFDVIDNTSGENMNDEDAVEFTITSLTQCNVTKKLLSPSVEVIHNIPYDNRGGKVNVRNEQPNDFGVRLGNEIWFDFDSQPDPIPTKVGDIIQVIITAADKCIFVKKL
jgi:hypothetical protein